VRPLLRVTALALTLAAPSAAHAATLQPSAPNTGPTPFAGRQLFMDCEAGREATARKYSAWYWVHHSSPGKAKLLRRIAEVPQAKWFTGSGVRPSPSKLLARYLARVDDPRLGGPNCSTPLPEGKRGSAVGSYPVLVARAMKSNHCVGYDGGGSWNQTGPSSPYRKWIDAFAGRLSLTWNGPERYTFKDKTRYPAVYFRHYARQAAVILEPDALGAMGRKSGCLSPSARRNRLANLSYAAKTLGALPGIATYIDAGASDWLTAHEAVSLLKRAGVRYVRGFALNSTHFQATHSEVAYGNRIARALHGKRFVVNTAENGRGSLPKRYWGRARFKSAWCNPANSGLGQLPTTHTGSRYADAFLWISRPGLSTNAPNGRGSCGKGPYGSVWYPARALAEAARAERPKAQLTRVMFGAPAPPLDPGPVAAAPPRAAVGGDQNPFTGHTGFVDCEAGTELNAAKYNPWYYVWKYAREGRTADSALVRDMAEVPTAKWFAGDSVRPDPSRMVERYLARVDDPTLGGESCRTHLGSLLALPTYADYTAAVHGQKQLPNLTPAARDPYVGEMPIMAIRAMVHAKCGGDQGAGRWNQVNGGLYKPWIDKFVAQIQRRWAGPFRYEFWASTRWPSAFFGSTERNAVVIIEPDALGLVSRESKCSDAASRKNTLALLNYAATKLAAVPGVTTYIDAGSSGWVDAQETVDLLRAAGVAKVRGFALNSTHFNATGSEVRYGDWVARRLGGHARYVVNTAENANGALPKRLWKDGNPKSAWCNPANAGLGQQPTTHTASPFADAYLWISRPGLSSNGKSGVQQCGRGPLDNVYWEERGLELAKQRGFKAAAWPPLPM
jgi:cellulase/cellobiase CelA1